MRFARCEYPIEFGFLPVFPEEVGDGDAGLEGVLEVFEDGWVIFGVFAGEDVLVVLEDVGVHF